MNSIISENDKYIGQYLHIKDTEFAVRMFTKFYNLAIHDNDFLIDLNTTKDLIHTGKYIKTNKLYVNVPDSDETILKSLNVGDYMVFIQETGRIYLFNKDEFKKFMNVNNYHKDNSISYVLGIDNGIEFDNMRVIVGNTLNTAKNIYMDRFKCGEPTCIGIMNNDHLEIYSDRYKFSIPLIM